jgi:hypothetical protein
MTRNEAVRILRGNEHALHARGVTRLALFGSLARDEGGEDSDIDVAVDIDPQRAFSLIDLADLRLFLRDAFGRETDVVIREDLRLSALNQTYDAHTIAFAASSAGGGAQAMRAHRQARPTPRGRDKRDPKGDLSSPPASLRGACDAPASRRTARLAG